MSVDQVTQVHYLHSRLFFFASQGVVIPQSLAEQKLDLNLWEDWQTLWEKGRNTPGRKELIGWGRANGANDANVAQVCREMQTTDKNGIET